MTLGRPPESIRVWNTHQWQGRAKHDLNEGAIRLAVEREKVRRLEPVPDCGYSRVEKK